jgi:hypothetical protein
MFPLALRAAQHARSRPRKGGRGLRRCSSGVQGAGSSAQGACAGRRAQSAECRVQGAERILTLCCAHSSKPLVLSYNVPSRYLLASNRRGVARTALLTNNVAFRRRPETAAATRLARTTAAAVTAYLLHTHHHHGEVHFTVLARFFTSTPVALSLSPRHTTKGVRPPSSEHSPPSLPFLQLASLPSAVSRQ